MRAFRLAFAAALAVLACAAPPPPSPQRGFYFWQTALDWKGADAAFARETGAGRIYLRVFDVDMDGTSAVPRAPVRVIAKPGLEIVPVVFIRPVVVSRLSENDLQDLAEKILTKTKGIIGAYPEIQIDCDWTPTTRENFFALLRAMRRRLPTNVSLSATIRLHQVKFREKTGIPPADRGVLMVYGTGSPADSTIENSILDPAEAARYLKGQRRYNLPLDVALPVYSSAVLFHGTRFRKILGEAETMPGAGFSRRNAQYCATKPVVWQGARLSAGDCLRIETADPALALQVRDLVLPLLQADSRVILFHYSTGLTRHGSTDIRNLFDRFHISAP